MLTEHKIKLTCPHCHKRSDNLIDRTFDNYDKKWHTSVICPLCNRLTEFKKIDANDIIEYFDIPQIPNVYGDDEEFIYEPLLNKCKKKIDENA